MNKPCDVIKIDKNTKKIKTPNILLMTRSFEIIGKISRYDNWNISLVGNGIDEITFTVNKYVNGKLCPIWDDLESLKIVDVDGFGRFEISVDYTDNTQTEKSVHGFSLEVELGQIPLYEFHVNDEDAMSMEITDYNEIDFDEHGEFIPTTFYNPKDEIHSLLHRILADKAPHWSIGYVTEYIALDEKSQPELSSTFQRSYTSDGTTIYDLLTGDIAKESNVIFIFDTVKREINCYSLCDCIDQDTGNILEKGIGEDTTVFISKRKLTSEIQITSNKDSVKNCFRIEGGDDVITDMIGAVNMNGSNYTYCFDDFQYKDMPNELVQKLKEYQNEMSSKEIQDEYYGENGIYTRLCKKYEDLSYYESEMMPNVEIKETTAEEQYGIMKQKLTNNTVAVSSYNNYNDNLFVGVSNNIEAYANILIDARYKAEVIKDSASFDSKNHIWTGNIQITRSAVETDYYPKTESDIQMRFTVNVVDDEMTFTRQKIEKALSKGSMLEIDFDIANMKDADIKEYFSQYCLNSLKSFYDGYNSCLSILMTLDSDSVVRTKLYPKYYGRMEIVSELMLTRQKQVDDIKKDIDNITKEQQKFQDDHNFQKAIGNDLYKVFCSYRREDTYKNDNYISDGLSTTQCLEKVKELISVATKEIQKACVLQRTISCSLNNLFALPEFEPLYDKFALFNYIRIQTDDEILKLRLIGVDFSGDSVENINVTFSEQIESVDGTTSDFESIIQQVGSISTSYSSTALQAKKGETARNNLLDLYNGGLNATNIMLSNNNHNEVTTTSAGIIAKRMDDEGYYGDKQLRITGNGVYLTKDSWKNVEMAIGEVFFNGSWQYGVLAPLLVGKMIAGNNLVIQDENGTVKIDGNGIVLSKGAVIKWSVDGSDGVKTPEIEEIQGLDNYLEQLDGRIQTYTQNTDPRTDSTLNPPWGKDLDHKGDLWVNPSTGIIKQWTGTSWEEVTDSYLKSLASSKAQIFTAKPTVAYFKGDMLIPAETFENNGRTYYAKKGYRAFRNSNGTTFSNDDWDELDYTNDNYIKEFINGDFKDTIDDLQSQVDGKAETYYGGTKPHQDYYNVPDNSEYNNWTGDLWFDEDTQKSYIYTKTGKGNGLFDYTWEFMDVPKSVYDTLDGKRQIFVRKPDSKYMTGDLWVISDEDCIDGKITVNSVIFEANSTLIAVLPDGVNERNSYVESDWHDISTHDGIVALDQSTQALNKLRDIADDGKITPSEKAQIKYTVLDIKSEYTSIISECNKYDNVSHSNLVSAYTNLINNVGDPNPSDGNATGIFKNMNETSDVISATFIGYFSAFYSSRDEISQRLEDARKEYSVNTSKSEIIDFQKNVLGATSTDITSKHVISPYLGGGYLYISKDGRGSVEINPEGITSTGAPGNIFSIKNPSGNEVIGMDSNGNANFEGNITATSLTLKNGVTIPSTKIDGLKNISSSKTQYQVGNSGTTTPTGTWLDTIPEVPSGKFLWSKITLTYTDSSTETYYSVGYNGVNGGDGTSISGVTNYYAISNSNTSYPTIGSADWGTGIKTPTNDKKYLWNYEVITYSKGNPTTTTPQVIGMYSKDGKGISSIIEKYLATNLSTGVTTSTSGWTSDVQSVSKENQYLWNYEVITYTDSTSTTINPHIVGTWGKEGDPGVSVTSVTPLYYLKSNKTAPSAPNSKVTSSSVRRGVWTTAIPTYVKDYYYFTCTQIEYSSGHPTFTPVILDNGTNAAIIQSFTTASDLAAYKTEITGENYVASADVKILETTTSNGITTQKIQVGSQQFDYVDTGDFICTDIGIGTPHTVNDGTTGSQKYVVISKEGLLTADNAVIRGSIYATNGYFSGELKAPTGTIGGWDISSTYIRKYDSATDYFMINSEDKAIYSRNEINKVVLTSGTLSFYKDEDLYTTICTNYFISNNEKVYGTDIISRRASKYIAFSDFSDITQPIRRANFIINYGLYPNRSDFIMHGDTYTSGAIRCSKLYTGIEDSTFVADEYGLYVNSNSYINGDEYVNGQLTTNTIKLNNKSGANDVIVFDDYGGSHSIGIGWTGTDIQIRIDEMYFKLATK